MNADAPMELGLRRLFGPRALVSALLRIGCTVFLLTAGFAGLAFLFDAQSTGPGRLQVNDAVRSYMLGVSASFLPIAIGIAIVVELTLPTILELRVPWRRTLLFVPLLWAIIGVAAAQHIFILEDVEIVPKSLMLKLGGGIVFYLAVSMHATLWQAAFDVAPEVTDFPIAWYLALVMMMSAFFGGFRGWTDVSPVVKGVLDYRNREWKKDKPPADGRPTNEAWIN